MAKKFDMSLLATPEFSIVLPVSGKRVSVRTMLMKEYKTLFVTAEGGVPNDAVEKVLKSTVSGVDDVLSLPVGDIEYLFIQLYVASTGSNMVGIRHECMNVVDGERCGENILTEFDLNNTFVPKQKSQRETFKINDNVQIILRAPTNVDFSLYDVDTDEGMLKCIISCMESIYQNDEEFSREEVAEELEAIFDSISGTVFRQMMEYIESTPRIMNEIEVVCPKCGNKETITLKGIDDFFM